MGLIIVNFPRDKFMPLQSYGIPINKSNDTGWESTFQEPFAENKSVVAAFSFNKEVNPAETTGPSRHYAIFSQTALGMDQGLRWVRTKTLDLTSHELGGSLELDPNSACLTCN